MSNLQLIEALCSLVEEEAAIIRKLYTKLDEMSAVSDVERASIKNIEETYSSIIGHDEAPDFLGE